METALNAGGRKSNDPGVAWERLESSLRAGNKPESSI